MSRSVEFRKIRHISDLSKNFGFEVDHIENVLSVLRSCAPSQTGLYQKIRIPKKNKNRKSEYRIVYKIKDDALLLLLKNIATTLAETQQPIPLYVQGFVRGRSIRTNALQHLSNEIVLKADIKKFFESITKHQVKDMFKKIGCLPEIAEDLAVLCTLDGFLFQGSSASPIIANLVCAEMDKELNLLSNQYKANYSRYADDITFSGKIVPSKDEVIRILATFGFKLNEQKFFTMKRGQPQFVTGLSIFDKKYPRVPKQFKKRLRLELYFLEKFGIQEHIKRIFQRKGIPTVDVEKNPQFEQEINRIAGWVSFIPSIEKDFGDKIKKQWVQIIEKSGKAKVKKYPSTREITEPRLPIKMPVAISRVRGITQS